MAVDLETLVEPHNVLVPCSFQYVIFLSNFLQWVFIFHHLLVYTFESNELACQPLYCQIDFTESSFTNYFADFVVVDLGFKVLSLIILYYQIELQLLWRKLTTHDTRSHHLLGLLLRLLLWLRTRQTRGRVWLLWLEDSVAAIYYVPSSFNVKRLVRFNDDLRFLLDFAAQGYLLGWPSLFVYVDFRLGGDWVGSLLLPHGWSATSGCRRDSAAVWLLALGYLNSFRTNGWLLEVSAILRNVIRIDLLSKSTRSISECSSVGIVEIPLFTLALVTNQHIRILRVRILSPMKNWNLWDAHRIDPFVVVSRSFYHCLWQCCYRIRSRMIDIPLIYRLLHPSIHLNVSAALRWLLPILIVFHVHILLYLSQVFLRLRHRNHVLQLWTRSLHIWKLQYIGLAAIGKLTTSLQRVVNTISNWLVGWLVGLSVILLWVVLTPDWICWAHDVSSLQVRSTSTTNGVEAW